MPDPVLSAAKVNKTQSGGEDVYVNDDTAVWGEPMEVSEDSSLVYDHQLYSLVFRWRIVLRCSVQCTVIYSSSQLFPLSFI